MSRRDRGLIVLGAFIVVWGIIAWLNALGLTDIDVCGLFWAIALMAIGGSFIWGAVRGGGELPVALRKDKYLGDIRMGGEGWELRDIDIQMGVGDTRLDLVGARIPPGETSIRVSGWVGTVRIWVPRGLAVRVQGGTWVGTVNLLGNRREGLFREFTASSPGYDDAETKVRIVADQIIGDIRVMRAG